MRQQRQASQEAQQRRALLQSLADRKQGARVLLDSSSDSDSDSEAPTSASAIQSGVASSYQSLNVAQPSLPGERKVLKRLSQQKENLPAAAQAQVLPRAQLKQSVHTPMSNAMSSETESKLLSSLSGMAITDSTDKPQRAVSKLATAIATSLPDDLPRHQPSMAQTAVRPVAKLGSSHSVAGEPVSSQITQEFQLKPTIANMLYKHQLEGVKWLWSLHKMRRGGILGV